MANSEGDNEPYRIILYHRLTNFYFICNLSLIMFTCPPCSTKSLPREYRSTAEKLFPAKGFSKGKGPSIDAAGSFANILGVGEDYKRLWNVYKSGQATGVFLDRFQNNLDLLIQKTWVEKSDEARKEALQDKVPPFISLIEKGDYSGALEEFGAILAELTYLFFGAQSQKDDFYQYVLRIDAQMGLFWWYGAQLNEGRGAPWIKDIDQKILYALLLIGICYLTNF